MISNSQSLQSAYRFESNKVDNVCFRLAMPHIRTRINGIELIGKCYSYDQVWLQYLILWLYDERKHTQAHTNTLIHSLACAIMYE